MSINASNLRNALTVLVEEDAKLKDLLTPVIDDWDSLRTFAEILNKTYEAGYIRPPVLYAFEVTGSRHSEFPVDMLRKGECWPSSTDDAAKINALIERQDTVLERMPTTVTIRLTCTTYLSAAEHGQIAQRWASFGWTVRELVEA